MCKEEFLKPYILTFGYGNRSNHQLFSSYLEEFQVAYVIDIRKSPKAWNRKWYREELEKLCVSKGITYWSETVLGNLSGTSKWISPNPEEANQVLRQIAKQTKFQTILLLCAEKDYQKCHRLEVANLLKELTNLPVKHLE
ncbi:MAG: DUF488 domain-containing protein [Hydrococcus sp. RM1_1_31]|nr:DUF488 domain-containing protein [Hydrococcus sp. RM1_1_31]